MKINIRIDNFSKKVKLCMDILHGFEFIFNVPFTFYKGKLKSNKPSFE